MKKGLILTMIFMLTGCYNYQELNDIAMVEYASIDYKDNEYILNYTINNPNKKDENFESTILEGKGATISAAINEINLGTSKEVYISHMIACIISEEVAKKGINNIADFFFRNPSSKKNFQILIVKKSDAKDVLEKLSSADNFQDSFIAKSFINKSNIVNTTLLSFIKAIKDQGIEPISPGIIIDKNGAVKIESLALFKGDRFSKWADEEIIAGINILYNQANNINITTKCQNGNIVFSINNLKIKKTLKINNNIYFNFDIQGNTEIEEMNCNYDLKNQNDTEIIENILITKLEDILRKTIDEIKTSKTDSIGLGFYIYQNSYYNFLKFKDSYLNHIAVDFEIKPNLLKLENSDERVLENNE